MQSNKPFHVFLGLVAAATLASTASANDPNSTAGSILQVTRSDIAAPTRCEPRPAMSSELSGGADPDEGLPMRSGGLANIGEKLWDLIVNNQRPVTVDFDKVKAHALPSGYNDPMKLDDWCGTNSSAFELDYRNIIGISLFKTRIQLSFLYGAKGPSGGKHIANVMVVPARLDTKLGFTANARVQVSDPVYLAGKVASMVVAVEVNVRGPFDSSTVTQMWEVRGDGKIIPVTRHPERIADAALSSMKNEYGYAINHALQLDRQHRAIAASCVEQVFGEWERNYHSVLHRTRLDPNQLFYTLEDYGTFMAKRKRDGEIRRAARPGAEDVVFVEIRAARQNGRFPGIIAAADLTVDPNKIAEFQRSGRECMDTAFLDRIAAQLPAAVLEEEYLAGNAKYHRVTWTSSDAGGIRAVWESRDTPY